MEEKYLIKSEIDRHAQNFLKKGSIISFLITAVFAILLTIPSEVVGHGHKYLFGYIYEYEYTYTATGWERMFDFGDATVFFILFLLGAICLLFSIVASIIYLSSYKCELQITESNITGKALFGKVVALPLHTVSACSTNKFCSVITIVTDSEVAKFALIGNYKEIAEVLEKKDNATPITNETTTQETANNTSLDDLVKLKSLLDAGIISQEEFDAKKKQILGL